MLAIPNEVQDLSQVCSAAIFDNGTLKEILLWSFVFVKYVIE